MATFRPGQVLTDARLNADEMIGQLVFQAGRASVQSIPNNTQTAVSFDTPTVDTLGAYSAGTPTRFTPNVAGYYVCSGMMSFASSAAGTGRIGTFAKNGTGLINIRMGYTLVALSTTIPIPPYAIYCNGTTDYIELRGLQDSGGALNTETGAGAPFLSIIYAGS